MIISNLFTAFLSIASVSASRSFAATNVDRINESSKRGESLPCDGGFFNTASVPSVSTNAGVYENFGCFEDGDRGKPLGSPLLNLTGAPAETIQSCVNTCSVSGQSGIPYTYAGIEPGSCWCSNYISILSVKSSSFCQSSCPSNSGKYCSDTVNGTLYMQIYQLRKGSGNVNPTVTTSVRTSSSSSLKSSVKSSSSTSQSRTTSTSTVPKASTTSALSTTSFSPIIEPTITTNSFAIPPDPPTIPPIVGPTGTESYILPSDSFSYPSEPSTTIKPNPWASLSLHEPDYHTTINPDAVPGDPLYTPTPLPPFNPDATSISSSTVTGSSIYSSPSTKSPSSTATTPAPPVRKFKREYDITAPDSPWLSLLPLTFPEILKEVPPGQAPGWEQQAIAKEKKLKSREYDIDAPDSPWRPLLPLHTPEILKEVPSDQVPGWQGQPSTPLIPDSDIPPKPKAKAKPKGKLHRRQLGPLPENFLEPPGRPYFVKQFPEKNTNKPLPSPFNKLKDPIDSATGKKIPPKKPNYSHSKISLQKRPSLKDIGLSREGRVSVGETLDLKDNEEEVKRKSEWKKLNEKEFANILHLQGTPKAYAEMEEMMRRRKRKERVRDVMEEWEKRIFMGLWMGKRVGDGHGDVDAEVLVVDGGAREDAIINRVLLGEEGWDGYEGEEEEEGDAEEKEKEDSWMWRKWGGKNWNGGKREGRKIHLERK